MEGAPEGVHGCNRKLTRKAGTPNYKIEKTKKQVEKEQKSMAQPTQQHTHGQSPQHQQQTGVNGC
jgi:hypothetical protein